MEILFRISPRCQHSLPCHRRWIAWKQKQIDKNYLEVFICTAVQIILWLFAQPVTGTLPRSIHALISSSIICLHFTAYCTVACWGDELTYVADADAMLTGEGKGETNTNSLVVNEELMYHAMHTGEDYGGTKTNFLEVNSTNFLDVYDELFKVL